MCTPGRTRSTYSRLIKLVKCNLIPALGLHVLSTCVYSEQTDVVHQSFTSGSKTLLFRESFLSSNAVTVWPSYRLLD